MNYKVKLFIILACISSLFSSENQTNIKANKLVMKREPSNLSYKEMMGGMGNAFIGIQAGILSQSKKLVETGVLKIQNHPAPKDKPWTIVKDEDKFMFKKTLLAYDELLHTNAMDILKALESNDWIKINKEVFNMSNNCTTCHTLWKNNLKTK